MHHLVGSVSVKQWGTIKLETEGECGGITLHNCLYIPGMRVNLFSGQKERAQGWEYTFQGPAGGIITVYRKDGKQICTIRESSSRRHTLICTQVRHHRPSEGEAVVAVVDVNVLHRRLGHANEKVLRELGKANLVRGLEGSVSGTLANCEGCKLGKAHDRPHLSRELEAREKSMYGKSLCGFGGTLPTGVAWWRSLQHGDCRRVQ